MVYFFPHSPAFTFVQGYRPPLFLFPSSWLVSALRLLRLPCPSGSSRYSSFCFLSFLLPPSWRFPSLLSAHLTSFYTSSVHFLVFPSVLGCLLVCSLSALFPLFLLVFIGMPSAGLTVLSLGPSALFFLVPHCPVFTLPFWYSSCAFSWSLGFPARSLRWFFCWLLVTLAFLRGSLLCLTGLALWVVSLADLCAGCLSAWVFGLCGVSLGRFPSSSLAPSRTRRRAPPDSTSPFVVSLSRLFTHGISCFDL